MIYVTYGESETLKKKFYFLTTTYLRVYSKKT